MQYRHDYEKREAYTRCRMEKWEAFCIRNAGNFFFIITNTIIFIVMYSIVVFGFVQKLKKGILQTGHTQTMWTSMGGGGVSEMSTLLIKPI